MSGQPLPLRMSSPLDQAIEAAIKAWPAAALAALGGAWAWFQRARKRWAKEREVRRLESKALRYTVDRDRHVMHALLILLRAEPTGEQLIDIDELVMQKRMLDDLREELWVLDGNQSTRATQQAADEILKTITRTQRIRAKTDRLKAQDMFRPEDSHE